MPSRLQTIPLTRYLTELTKDGVHITHDETARASRSLLSTKQCEK